eukprot:218262-Alexandrium_andersonii.AAC.1
MVLGCVRAPAAPTHLFPAQCQQGLGARGANAGVAASPVWDSDALSSHRALSRWRQRGACLLYTSPSPRD